MALHLFHSIAKSSGHSPSQSTSPSLSHYSGSPGDCPQRSVSNTPQCSEVPNTFNLASYNGASMLFEDVLSEHAHYSGLALYS